MEKLPTAEAFMLSSRISNPVGEMFRLNLSRDCHVKTEKDIQQAMIEFAKLHVEAALKAASENVIVDTFAKNRNKRWVKKEGEFEFDPTDFEHKYVANKNSVLSSYPLNKIK